MTKFDIKNYFERIYNVKVEKVNTRIQLGEFYTTYIVVQWALSTARCPRSGSFLISEVIINLWCLNWDHIECLFGSFHCIMYRDRMFAGGLVNESLS